MYDSKGSKMLWASHCLSLFSSCTRSIYDEAHILPEIPKKIKCRGNMFNEADFQNKNLDVEENVHESTDGINMIAFK